MAIGSRQYLAPVAILVALAVAEKLLVLHLPPDWLLASVHFFGGAPAGFGLAIVFFGWRKLATITWRSRLSPSAAVVHGLLLTTLIGLQLWYTHIGGTAVLTPVSFRVIATVWTAMIPFILFSLIVNFVPVRSVWHLVRSLREAWLYAAAVTAAVLLFRHMEDAAWTAPTSGLLGFIQQSTFEQTRAVLRGFYPVVISDPATHILGTARFQVEVAWLCSGIEGLVLVTLLIALWIIFFRKELIIRRALLVAPVALVLTWFANIVRLASLIAIGDRGHRVMADVGFHAQAGWVSLNLIALGCLFFVQRHPWFRKDGEVVDDRGQAHEFNYTVVYLLPFTLTIAASMITQALAEGFEALYALRFVVALAALWLLRAHYRQMNWRFGLGAVLGGLAIGGGWLVVALKFKVVSADALITANVLSQMARPERWAWIATRVLAATFTVPIAEELAFRGFVARRVMRADFENQPYRRMNWISLVVSSLAFGAMHGRLWAAGIVAGALFWWVARFRNRIGEAVAAHAIANGLIAIVAVRMHDYSLW